MEPPIKSQVVFFKKAFMKEEHMGKKKSIYQREIFIFIRIRYSLYLGNYFELIGWQEIT